MQQKEQTLIEPSTFLTRLFFGHHSNTCNTSSSNFCSSPADICLTGVSAHMQLANDTCYCRCLLYSHSGQELKKTGKTPLAQALPVTEEQHMQCCMTANVKAHLARLEVIDCPIQWDLNCRTRFPCAHITVMLPCRHASRQSCYCCSHVIAQAKSKAPTRIM